MPASLEGKVAVVTGVSGDGQVGQAVAKALAEAALRWRFVRASKATWKSGLENCDRLAPECSPWLGL